MTTRNTNDYGPYSVEGWYPLYSSSRAAFEASPRNEAEPIYLAGRRYFRPLGLGNPGNGVVFNGDHVAQEHQIPVSQRKPASSILPSVIQTPVSFQIINFPQVEKKKTKVAGDVFTRNSSESKISGDYHTTLTNKSGQIKTTTKVSTIDGKVSQEIVDLPTSGPRNVTEITGSTIQQINSNGILYDEKVVTFVSGSNIRIDTDNERRDFIRISVDEINLWELEDVNTNMNPEKGEVLIWDPVASEWTNGNVDLQETTGILYGGVITAEVGGTTFDVSAGIGHVITYTANSSGASFDREYISWSDFEGVTLDFIASDNFTYLYIDDTGDLIQLTTPFTELDYQTKIIIGTICHIDNATITLATNKQSVGYHYAEKVTELFNMFGPMKKSGLRLTPNDSNLKFDRSSGEALVVGGNYATNQFDPDNVVLSAVTGVSFCRLSRDGSGGYTFDTNNGTFYEFIDPTKYDNNTGTLQTVNNNQWTIQRLFMFSNTPNDVICYYGVAQYNSKSDAIDGIVTESFAEAQITKENAVFLGDLIIRGGATNLSSVDDAKFLPAGFSRAAGGVGGGGGDPGVGTEGPTGPTGPTGEQGPTGPTDLRLLETTTKTSSYTLDISDAYKVVTFNASGGATLSVPDNAVVAFDIGTTIHVYNRNASSVLIAPGDIKVVIRKTGVDTGTVIQFEEVYLRKRGTNEWVLVR